MVLGTDKVFYFNTPSVLEFYLCHKDGYFRRTKQFEKLVDESKIKHLQKPRIVCEINGEDGDNCYFDDAPLFNFAEIAKNVFQNKGYSLADILTMEDEYSNLFK